jgi:hypothetical protein
MTEASLCYYWLLNRGGFSVCKSLSPPLNPPLLGENKNSPNAPAEASSGCPRARLPRGARARNTGPDDHLLVGRYSWRGSLEVQGASAALPTAVTTTTTTTTSTATATATSTSTATVTATATPKRINRRVWGRLRKRA